MKAIEQFSFGISLIFSQHSVSKYNVKVKEGNTEIDETVEIDTENEIEKIHIPSNGDTSESAPGEVDVVFDFKLNLAVHRLGNGKACFLSNSPDILPKPADLKRLLDSANSQSFSQRETMKREYNYVVAGTLLDRSFLSDEMASLCAKLPIYRVKAVTGENSQLKSGVTVTRLRSRRYGCRIVRRCYTVTILFLDFTCCHTETECD
ncbi:uncharacterized protein LOC141860192 [Acropora palmata]|uniref:uncharacterized protein LOC141860192 n=1 Tax=Acropora palmata TaxID=6131 RepID=UPI003DA18899